MPSHKEALWHLSSYNTPLLQAYIFPFPLMPSLYTIPSYSLLCTPTNKICLIYQTATHIYVTLSLLRYCSEVSKKSILFYVHALTSLIFPHYSSSSPLSLSLPSPPTTPSSVSVPLQITDINNSLKMREETQH